MIFNDNGIRLFSEDELKCKGSGLLILAPGFNEMLKELRVTVDLPMYPNSCCRSKEHNKNVNGHHRSLHVCDKPFWPTGGTCAIDLGRHWKLTDIQWAEYQRRVKDVAWDLGWSIGDHPNFIHLDRRTDFIPKTYKQHRQLRFKY